QIVERAEFQDGLAFVVRSEQILDTIDAADIGHSTASSMSDGLTAVQDAYDMTADPSEVESLTTEVINAINGVLALGYSPERVDLAGGLEETMGHLWALELNLNEGNY
ncbi:MAG: PEFG-CTERM domain-containing protein, partial [Nitrosopumilaceae archaeon]|nr:PEFG-CTERM domain-containing protein [Nitrosopumilaceae archaeon]